ncbi:hypothetical protein C0995_006953 [Termitomyces sp. Mi166|nr:hypothetical protein C0995_006953 [Termitomyces sp. Mi166\
MSRSVADVPNKLGEYMLKGWVLTDQSCKTPDCSVPLMRSPNGRTPVVHFCVKCDAPGAHPKNLARSETNVYVAESRQQGTLTTSGSTSSATSDSNPSRSSTPPTEVSSTSSSPIFAPAADTEESRRRREQSDIASAEIGKRLLKGWAMLGDECPNTRCFGVPLVRPPKAGGDKDPRKTLRSPQLQALEDSASALQSTLHTLSARLRISTNPQAVIDPSSIGATADAISKVTQALSHVRQLQWSESQAQGL